MKRFAHVIFALLVGFCVPTFVSADNIKPEKAEKLSVDGPYVFHQADGGLRIISVNKERELKDTVYKTVPDDFSLLVTPHGYGHPFQVQLHSPLRPDWKVTAADKILVLSDPHGDLHSFISILKAQQVIDAGYNWIFGRNQLVIIGDVFDRGEDVTAIFWLIYKLEQEAAEAGGQVFFLLGNHEEMVLRGDIRYARSKYKNLADTLGVTYQALFNENSELGRWLRTRNLVQVIGDNLFVHAGLSAGFLERKESVEQMNETVSRGLSLNKEGRKNASPLSAFIYDTKVGPLWYRGMVKDDEKYQPVTVSEVKRLLKKMNVQRILTGHTIFEEVTPFYNGQVIAVNVDNKENRKHDRSRGVLIENGRVSLVYDSKLQQPLMK